MDHSIDLSDYPDFVTHSPKFMEEDPGLVPYKQHFKWRAEQLEHVKGMIECFPRKLEDFTTGHKYFEFNECGDEITFREWLPGAKEVYLTGDFNGWSLKSLPLTRDEFGVWSRRWTKDEFPVKQGTLYKLYILNAKNEWVFRNPAYARRVVQNNETLVFDAMYERPSSFKFVNGKPVLNGSLKIYEAHIGMSSNEQKIASFNEFRTNVLPVVKQNGYNCVQLMAVKEHAYYGSFGYHVTNFFAVSSRYGTADEFKALIDEAHRLGIYVLLDLVHSHASRNTADGIGDMDGTDCQYFPSGEEGHHRLWDSRIFDYNKPEVLRFLLSNIRYWLEEFNLDGFRFDGVTSILYKHHGELTRHTLRL